MCGLRARIGRKNQGGFPAGAIASVLQIARLGLDQVDRVGYAGRMLPALPVSSEVQRLGYKQNSRSGAALRDVFKSTLIDRARQG